MCALRSHPAQFRIMFGPEITDKATHPALKAAAERAFALLVSAIADAQRARQVRGGDPEQMTAAAWALVHGLSALLIDRQLERHGRSPCNAEILARRVTRLLLTGLLAASGKEA